MERAEPPVAGEEVAPMRAVDDARLRAGAQPRREREIERLMDVDDIEVARLEDRPRADRVRGAFKQFRRAVLAGEQRYAAELRALDVSAWYGRGRPLRMVDRRTSIVPPKIDTSIPRSGEETRQLPDEGLDAANFGRRRDVDQCNAHQARSPVSRRTISPRIGMRSVRRRSISVGSMPPIRRKTAR